MAMPLTGQGCGARAPEVRNLVLISVDALNLDVLEGVAGGCNSNLPGLTRLVGESVVVTRAHSTSSWTLPSHGSLLTGLYPGRHGLTHLLTQLAPSQLTLAEILADSGFETVGCTGGGYLDTHFGLGDGFQSYVAGDLRTGEEPPFERGLHYLRERGPEAPRFFLFLHTYRVHNYFYGAAAPESGADALSCLTGRASCQPERWQELEALYRREVEALDRDIGRLLDTLDEIGERERTLIVLVSDHGEGLDPQHGRIHHGGRLHGDLIRIPMLFSIPGAGGRVLDQAASLIDVLPSALELLGLPVPQDLDGESIAGALRGGAVSGPRTLYAMEHSFLWEDGVRVGVPEPPAVPLAVAVIRDEHWYIRTPEGEELYSVQEDPTQRRCLAPDHPAWPGLRLLAEDASSASLPETREGMDEDLERQLRSLGYLN